MTEEIKTEKTAENESLESTEENMTIEETREALAEMYLNFLDQQKWGMIATGASLGVNLNPMKKSAMEYLTSQDDKSDKKGIFANIEKNIKKKVMEKFAWGTFIEYDKTKLSKMKALILAHKDDQVKLEELMSQIQQGEDPTGLPDWQTTSDQQNKETKTIPLNSAIVLPVYAGYNNLKEGDDASKEDIAYITEQAKYIVEHLETKGSLSNIEKIKDKNGKVILECKGKTPYISSKAAADLVGLSLLYYKKTGKQFILESGFRTIEHQKRLKKENSVKGVPTADPGYSWHNLWYSIDVSKESRYDEEIGWVVWLQTIAKIFNFNPISSEDRHFDYSEFVEKYYDDKEARLPEAQKLDALFEDEKKYNQAA